MVDNLTENEKDKIKVDMALKMYEQGFSNIRHWDQIRWLVPSWFVTLSIGAFGVFGLSNTSDHKIFACFAFLGLTAFAAACYYLMGRLIFYHNTQVKSFEEIEVLVPKEFKNILLYSLPFNLLKNDELKKTATYWFMMIIASIGVLSLIICIYFLIFLINDFISFLDLGGFNRCDGYL